MKIFDFHGDMFASQTWGYDALRRGDATLSRGGLEI